MTGTKLRLTPAANVGYGFTYWGDDADDTAESKTITMDADQSVKVNFEEVKHQVTVAAAENGTVVLKVGYEIITPTDGKAEVGEGAQVIVLARPNLFYTMSGVTVTETDDATTPVEVTNGKFTIPAYDVTITPSFTAEKSISEGKTWTFSTAEGTTNTITDFGEGLYLRAGSKAFTKVDSITSVILGGETINISSALQTPSSFTAPDDATTSATVVSPISSAAGVPMIAVNAASKGTIYVATSPVADGSGQTRIYFGNGTDKPAQMVNPTIAKAGEVYTTSYTTYAPGTFYIGTTVAANIYAVKFVPLASSDGVTLTQDGTNYVLSNGKVTAVINEKGQVDQLLTEDGKYVIKAGSAEAGCLDYTINNSNRELQKSSEALTVTKVKETSDMVELRFTNDKNNLAQTWSLGYIMRKDVSGLYTYATMEGAKDGAYQEARFKWRPNESFNYAWVSDDVQGQMPPYDRLVDDYKVQDATFTLADGTIYTKYDWANYMKDDLLHGVMNTTNGAWAIAPNMEWMNGGVQKQELTVHADNKGPVLLQMLQGEHFGASAYTAAVGSKQFYGPTLLYINSGETKEAMIADAKQQAAKEVEAWPYSWFSHDDYPTAADRATVTGTITLNHEDFSTTKLQVILADASTEEPLQQSGGYQYATEATSTDGNYAFTIKNVRPGSYAVFAYALNGDATGMMKSSKAYSVAAGSTNVGTIAWTPAKYTKKLWQIGEADRTTSGFKLSDHKRQYGMWDGSVVADAGIPAELTYTVGTSQTSDWYYAQTKDNSTWTVKFNNTETYAEPLHLTIAVAGSSRKPTLTVNMNDTEVYKAAYPNSDGALYRSGVLSGRSGLIEIEIPAAAVKVGENNLTLVLSGGDSGVGGLLYDCIKLEAGESEMEDLGNRLWDFSEWTFDEGTTKKNLTEVTNSKNLYYRAGPMNDTSDGRSIAINKNTVGPFTWNFPDGETYTRAKNVGNYATLPGNGTLAPANDLTPATKLGESLPGSEDSNNRTVAFTTTKAGTVYVAFRGTAGRDYKVFFKPTSGESYNAVAVSQVDATDSNKGILFYTAAEGGHFLIGGAAAMTTYMIKFEPAETTYQLTTAVTPENSGVIQKAIAYTADAVQKTYAVTEHATVFLPGTQLNLTAEPGAGYQFTKWSDNSTELTTTVTMDTAKSLTATFEPASYSIAVDQDIQYGTVVVADGLTKSADGATIDLTITPDDGYLLKSVTVKDADNNKVAAVMNDGIYHFIMPATNVTISAEFATETAISEETTWNFATIGVDSIKAVTEIDGLYYRAGATGRAILVKAADKTATVGDVTLTSANYLQIPKNGDLKAENLSTDYALGTVMTGGNDNRSVAFNTAVPGTVYVMASNNTGSLWFKGKGQNAYAKVTTTITGDKDPYVLQYEAPEGGTFIIGNTESNINVYAIKFVPAATYTLNASVTPEGAGKIKVVVTNADNYETYVSAPTRFKQGAALALTAEAKGENTFLGWDNTTETGAKTITMTADLTVVANFDKVTFSAIYLPEEMYQEQGEFTFNTTSPVTVWAAERTEAGTWEGKKYTDFQYLTNMDTNKVSVRVGAQSITYGEDNSIRLSRPMAIHNLDVDDEITILYAGSGSLASVTTAEGDDFTIDGTEAEAGKAIPSGALLKVTGISTGGNYVVVGPASSSPIYIKGIYINTKAPEFLHTPTVELKSVEGETAVYTISYDEGATLHYQLSTEENEQEGDTSGAFDLNITESAKMTAWTTKGDLKSENLETTIFAPTPAPSEDGNFDFSEASEDLPADMEVTLDETHPVTVEGETFYKPSPLTAATFDDKFAFSETTTSDKIKIRTNRQLVFAKGADMDMAILNLEKGDIIAFDYSGGTIEFSASDIITTDQSSVSGSRRAVAANETLVSGENYVVTGEGDLILHLKLTSTAVSIAKMALTKVAKPSAPKALDFATTQEEEETLEEGHAVTVYYNGQDASQRFFRLNNNSDWLPAEGKISTPSGKAGLTTGGLKIDRNRFAIHDLAVGDTIKIRFYGGELTFEGHATKGDKIKVKSTGAAIEPGAAMESGVTIVVDKVDYLNNYLVFMLDKTCVVSGIFINKKETEKIIAPSLRDRGNGTLVQITPGRSTMDREVFTCYTTDGTDPSMVNGTSGIMTDVFDLEIVELHDCDVLVKAISYSRDGAISKMVEVTVQVTGIITDISGVPTIDGKPATIYDLRGHKVTTMMKGQIYIINGKKYLYK